MLISRSRGTCLITRSGLGALGKWECGKSFFSRAAGQSTSLSPPKPDTAGECHWWHSRSRANHSRFGSLVVGGAAAMATAARLAATHRVDRSEITRTDRASETREREREREEWRGPRTDGRKNLLQWYVQTRTEEYVHLLSLVPESPTTRAGPPGPSVRPPSAAARYHFGCFGRRQLVPFALYTLSL